MPHPINIDMANIVSNALDTASDALSIDISAVKPFIMAQTGLETEGFTSNVSQVDNNFSGIKYSKNGYGSLGVQSPEGNHYAHYDTPEDWAKDMLRVLSIDRGAGVPLDTNSLVDYNNALKGTIPNLAYYGIDAQTYLSFLKSYYNSISLAYPGLFLVSTLSELKNDVSFALGLQDDTSPNAPTQRTIGFNVIIAGFAMIALLFSLLFFMPKKSK